MTFRLLHALACVALFAASVTAQEADESPRLRTMLVTRSLRHSQLLPYLKEARPDIVQVGNYGAMFHGYADHPKSTGWPMQLPVSGEVAALRFQNELNRQVHGLGLKVVGHFRLVKVMGNWKEQTGFCDYYDHRWPTKLLGEKPHPKLEELLQRSADGTPLQLGRYNQSQLGLCLSSPHTVKMLKRMLKIAIDQGIDGVNTNFNYRFECGCPYCQESFERWLRLRLSAKRRKALLNLPDPELETHHFKTLRGAIPGYPGDEATELDWLASAWAAEHFKNQFDEIFLRYGRSLKPDLIVAQWNHLGHVNLTEERMFLPRRQWGKGEDYFWYSGGASFVGRNLDLDQHKAGDAWLSCLYVREMSGGKPFVMGKYDRIRMAASMAEGFATSGMGMGRYMRFEDPAGFQVLSRYTRFRNLNDPLYAQEGVLADVGLVLPRQSVLNRRPESLTTFRDLGQLLLELPLLLDVVADEGLTAERLAQYPVVVAPAVSVLRPQQIDALRAYVKDGGQLISVGDFATDTITDMVRLPADDLPKAAAHVARAAGKSGHVQIEAPWTVRAAGYRSQNAWKIHLVNYDREQSQDQRAGPAAERPKPVSDIKLHLRGVPPGRTLAAVRLHSPDSPTATLPFERAGDRVETVVPTLKVYDIVEFTWNSK